MSIFWEDGPSIANALPFSLSSKTYDVFVELQTNPRFAPHIMLNHRQDYIIQIANFLKYMATEFGNGNPIRIYGYREGVTGFGNRGLLTYFPTRASPVIDIEMPVNNEFYYEIDPNDLDAFSLEHFRIFLGALFADHQGFFVRTEGMGAGEFLFAFNLFKVLEKLDIAMNPSSKYAKPISSKQTLSFIDPDAFSDLSDMWNAIILDMKNDDLLATIHRYSDIKDWHAYLKLLPMLHELKSSFKSLLFSFQFFF